MKFKKYLITLFLLILSFECFSQEEISFRENKLNFDANYYGLPLEGKIGYKYRNQDFSIFPYLGLLFDVKDSYSVNLLSGINLIYKDFSLENKINYELLPALLQKNYNFISYQLTPGYSNNICLVKIPITYGYKKFYKSDDSSISDNYLSGKIVLNSFIIDNGLLRITSIFETEFYSIYNKKFNFYTAKLSIPCSIYISLFDFGIKYDFSMAKKLNINNLTATDEIRISFPYSSVTKRIPFKKEKKDNILIHSLEFEQRFYPFRINNLSSNFFISVFENIGIAFTTEENYKFLYQCGFCVGYNLYDSVPFLLQAGINQDKEFILSIGVISNISHRP